MTGTSTEANETGSVKEKLSLKTIGNNILNYMAGSLTPLIPLLMVVGLFKTIAAVLGPEMLAVLTPENNLYILLDFAYDAGFYFLPILLGFQAAKKLGATPVLGAYMGCILMAPDFLAIAQNGTAFDILGIPVIAKDYSQTVLPVILSVWVLSLLERFFKTYLLRVSSMTLIRPMEVEMACDPKIREWIRENDIQLVTYDEL